MKLNRGRYFFTKKNSNLSNAAKNLSNMNLAIMQATNSHIEGKKDYQRERGITRGNEGLLEGMKDY